MSVCVSMCWHEIKLFLGLFTFFAFNCKKKQLTEWKINEKIIVKLESVVCSQ